MSGREVLAVVAWLEAAGAVYQVNGGWAVDALAGRQTRSHRDVDVFVDEAKVSALLDWLGARGYVKTEGWLPTRVEFESEWGRVDVHPMRLDEHGNGIQRGLGEVLYVHPASARVIGHIEGQPLVVADRDRLRELRTGYDLRDVDQHDLAVLDDL